MVGVFTPYQLDAADESETVLLIPKGYGFSKLQEMLQARGIVTNKIAFYLAALFANARGKLKAGEFQIPPRGTYFSLIQYLVEVKPIQHYFTVVEGTTVYQVLQKLEQHPYLVGTITDIPLEGMLLPETYSFQRGTSRQNLLNQIHKAMNDYVHQLYQGIKSCQPLVQRFIDHPMRLITLASIVEKETAKTSERPMIAAVFYNRLQYNMPLQSDPTVVYGLTEGKGALGRKLLRKDLQFDSPLNTYTNKGIPPAPIACPSKHALISTLNPAFSDALYFVADGTGGHIFTQHLRAHNQAVLAWRKIRDLKN